MNKVPPFLWLLVTMWNIPRFGVLGKLEDTLPPWFEATADFDEQTMDDIYSITESFSTFR